jgi:hypothetical protein
VSGSEVLDMMGSSFGAMWGAVGAAGMAPFVADRLQWGAMAAGMAAQMKGDLPQVRGRLGGRGWYGFARNMLLSRQCTDNSCLQSLIVIHEQGTRVVKHMQWCLIVCNLCPAAECCPFYL